MALPAGTELEALADTLRLDRPSSEDDWSPFVLIDERRCHDSQRMWSEGPTHAWYRKASSATPDGLVRKVTTELAIRGHASSPEIARAVIALALIRRGTVGSTWEALGRLIESVATCSCSEYLLAAFPPPADYNNFRLADFDIGRVDRSKLQYMCERVKCDFFQRYPAAFRGVFSIQRSSDNAVVIPITTLREVCRIPENMASLERRVIDHYFESLSRHRLGVFQKEFSEAQHVVVAAGAPVIDVYDVNFWFESTFVCLFSWRNETLEGYFCPLGQGVIAEFGKGDQRIVEKLEYLRRDFGFERLSDSSIHCLIGTYARMVTAARRKDKPGTRDEAFLNFVIALDLVFGEKDASNRAIANRVAVVSATALGLSVSQARQRMKEIYDLRSKYVHKGMSVPEHAISLVDPIVGAVFECLMRLQTVPAAHERDFPEKWLRQLDFLVAAYDAGREPSEADLKAAGCWVN